MTNELDDIRTELARLHRRTRRLTFTNIVLAVTVLAFGGSTAAYALAAANSVNSTSIIDGSIVNADVKEKSLWGSRIVDNGISSTKIANNTLTSADVANNSLTGDDIKESTLEPTCPVGTTKAGDVCFTPQRESAGSRANAIYDCADEKLRLPSLGEAELVGLNDGSSDYVLTAGEWIDGSTTYFWVTNGGTTTYASGSAYPYYCVTTVGARP